MQISIYNAKTHLSRLLDRAAKGEEIVITRHGRPIGKLVPVVAKRPRRKLGLLRGKIRIAKDFDAPLPASVLADFEGA